jgi:hypothetical protein
VYRYTGAEIKAYRERSISVELKPREPIVEKCSHLREKGGVLMLLKTTLHL